MPNKTKDGHGSDGDGRDHDEGEAPRYPRARTASGSVALPITVDEHDHALATIVGEMSPWDLFMVPGVYDALRKELRERIVERAIADRPPPAPEPGSDADPDRVHRLIQLAEDMRDPGADPYETACGAPPDADGGSDADPANVTCQACRDEGPSLPRTRTRDRRAKRPSR